MTPMFNRTYVLSHAKYKKHTHIYLTLNKLKANGQPYPF